MVKNFLISVLSCMFGSLYTSLWWIYFHVSSANIVKGPIIVCTILLFIALLYILINAIQGGFGE